MAKLTSRVQPRSVLRQRDRPQSFALPGVPAELIDIIDGQRACKRGPNPGKVRGRQRGLPSVGVETAAWIPSLSLVDPRDLPPQGGASGAQPPHARARPPPTDN